MGPEGYAKVFGSPGQGARSSGLVKSFWPLLFLLLLGGYLMGSAFPLTLLPLAVLGLLLLVCAAGVARTVIQSEEKLGLYYKGAEGEEQVARLLGFLPSDYSVYHSIPALQSDSGGMDFDHIVVGRGKVFLIETKNWSSAIELRDGAIWFDGQHPSRPPLKQVADAGLQLRDALNIACGISLEVEPVLCFVTSDIDDSPLKTGGVWLCDGRELLSVIENAEEGLASEAMLSKVNDVLQKVDS